MKKWNSFFDEEPPAGHAERVMKAAKSELEVRAVQQKRSSWSDLLTSWQGFSVAGGLAAAVFGFWIVYRNSPEKNSEAEIANFQAAFGSNSNDFELLADDSSDLDLLENMDLLEEMEEA